MNMVISPMASDIRTFEELQSLTKINDVPISTIEERGSGVSVDF